jgi:hypothetical protein
VTLPVSDERRAKVDAACRAWIGQLIDRSRRNNLLYYRDLQKGTLDLAGADLILLQGLFAGESIALAKLCPRSSEDSLGGVVDRAAVNREERGLETLYVALGFVTWASADGNRPPNAPILLLPVKIDSSSRSRQAMHIEPRGDAVFNLALLQVLNDEFGLPISSEELLAKSTTDELSSAEAKDLFHGELLPKLIADAMERIAGFEIRGGAVLGNFSFQKSAMVEDLQKLREQLVTHDVVATMAGDAGATSSIRSSISEVSHAELDGRSPEDDFTVFEADSSQEAVVVAALRGEHMVVQGPPGTGKSQTIANLIATLCAHGKTVLFVAEKKAALDVVRDRLKDQGLGHLTLDLHGADPLCQHA